MRDRREAYLLLMAELDPRDLVFIDEMGTHCSMALSYGWAPRGDRLRCHRPKARGTNVTSIGAIGLNGMLTLDALDGRNTNPTFEEWVRRALVPLLRPGNIVILDNLRQHRQDVVREAIEAVGAEILFLPPYSPEFNAIEECWSKVKNYIRRRAPRDPDSLRRVLREARQIVTAEDALGWIKHAGYRVQAQCD